MRLGGWVVLSAWSSGASGAATVDQTDIRRSGPLSKLAGHPGGVPHRTLEGSPCGRAHPLLEAEKGDGQVLLSGCSVAIAQTKPASSRAQATTIFWCGLPRPAIRCQRW